MTTIDDVRNGRATRLQWPTTILFIEDDETQLRHMISALCRALFPEHVIHAPDVSRGLLVLEAAVAPDDVPAAIVIDSDACRQSTGSALEQLKCHAVSRNLAMVVLAGPWQARVSEQLRGMADGWMARPTDAGDYADVVNVIHAMWLTRSRSGPRRS